MIIGYRITVFPDSGLGENNSRKQRAEQQNKSRFWMHSDFFVAQR
jgi:hypothetical protein